MSEKQVTELLGSAVASPGPDRLDIDAMVRGGVQRRRRRMLATLAAVAAVLVVVGAVVVTARPSADVSPASDVLPLPTSAWRPGDDARAAQLVTTLRLEADGCITAEDGSPLIWPAGYTAERSGSSAVIKDGGGDVVAEVGQEVALGGGYGNGADGQCLSGRGEPYYVEQAPPYATEQPAQTIAVPDLAGLPKAQAVGMLEELGLEPGSLTAAESTDAQLDTVVTQQPAAGSVVAAGSSIDLAVGQGAGTFEGLRGTPLPAGTTCDTVPSTLEAVSIEPIPGNAVSVTVCAGPGESRSPVVFGPQDVLSILPVLEAPDEVLATPVPCPASPVRPWTVLVETDRGVFRAHLPRLGCGQVQPKVADALGLAS
ncbi:MAG: PASTA domain-containing protein [Candidatus Nanopelagicales bacterium]